MKKFLFVSILLLVLFAAGVSALSFSPSTTLTLPNSDPGNTVTDSTLVDIISTEATQHIIRFSDGALSQGSRTINMALPSDITLAAAASADVNIQVSIPANQYAGAYTGNLVATSTTSSTVTTTLPVSLTVNSNPLATINSPSFTAGRGVTRTADNVLTISNTGNTDLNSVSISVNDLSDGTNTLSQSAISFTPSSTSINYGSNVNVDVVTNIPSTQALGTYTGQITINYGGSTTATGTLSITVRDPIHNVGSTSTEVLLGGSTQQREQTVNQAFTVQNSGDYTETVTVALSGVNSKYNAQLDTTGLTLQPGQSQTVTVTATIPKNQDSGVKTLGSVQLAYNNGASTETIPVKLETQSMLDFSNVEVKVGDKSASSVSDGETVGKTAKPGDDIEFDIKIENLFTSVQDLKIEDIIITLTGQDDDFDSEEETDEFDVSDGQDKSEDLKFTVPDKINEGEYDFELHAEGEDENGATHEVTWTVSIEVNKDSNDVRIETASFGSETLQCVRTTELRVTISNYGSDSQDKAALVIFSPDLGINENIMDIYLDEDFEDDDNEFTKTVTINLADDFAAGSYPVTIKAYRNNDREMDEKIIYLKVEDCPVEEPEEEEEDTTVIITPPTSGTGTGSTGTSGSTSGVVETVETSFTNSTAFILLLVGLDLIILLVVLVLVFKFLF
ncbi:MAG: hypothetical protein KAT77_03370 [Nanoarchaeota archaeon]|nr:hypothetical protein [Nanoarchaeota archaeon]